MEAQESATLCRVISNFRTARAGTPGTVVSPYPKWGPKRIRRVPPTRMPMTPRSRPAIISLCPIRNATVPDQNSSPRFNVPRPQTVTVNPCSAILPEPIVTSWKAMLLGIRLLMSQSYLPEAFLFLACLSGDCFEWEIGVPLSCGHRCSRFRNAVPVPASGPPDAPVPAEPYRTDRVDNILRPCRFGERWCSR